MFQTPLRHTAHFARRCTARRTPRRAMSQLLWTMICIIVPLFLLMNPQRVAGLLGMKVEPSQAPKGLHVEDKTQTRGVRGFGRFAMEGVKNGAASGLASASVKMLLQPLDVIKTVQQNSPEHLTIVGAVKDVVDKRGVLSLFSGFNVALVGAVPSMAVYFGVYQFLKKNLVKMWGPQWQVLAYAVSAALSNFFAAWFRVPAEILKVRLQANVYSSVLEGIYDVYARGGISQFIEIKSVMVQIIRDVPYAVFCLVSYEVLRASVLRWKARAKSVGNAAESASSDGKDSGQNSQLGLNSMWIGAASGGLASLLSNPMDVVKTRWMVAPDKYSGIGEVVMHLWHSEGAAAFFKGATARVSQKVPSNALFFTVFEFFRALLGVA